MVCSSVPAVLGGWSDFWKLGIRFRILQWHLQRGRSERNFFRLPDTILILLGTLEQNCVSAWFKTVKPVLIFVPTAICSSFDFVFVLERGAHRAHHWRILKMTHSTTKNWHLLSTRGNVLLLPYPTSSLGELLNKALRCCTVRLASAKECFGDRLALARSTTNNWYQKMRTKKGAEPKPCPTRLLLIRYIESDDCLVEFFLIGCRIALNLSVFATGLH